MKNPNSGVIVALLPDSEYTRLRPTIGDHHMTVAFLGRIGDPDLEGDLNIKAIRSYWKNLVKLWTNPIPARITAEAMFDVPWKNQTRKWAHVDLIDAPLAPLFRSIVEELLPVHGLPIDLTHGFLPHITRRYIDQDRSHIEFVQRKGDVSFSFDRMAVWFDDERFEKEL